MQKIYNIVKVMLIFALLFTQNNIEAQNCCLDCQSDLKLITNKRVLLEKIDLKAGTTTSNVNTNLYVSYRSGNAQKFWGNLAIATAGVAVSTQLKNGNPSERNNANSISPIIPLSVSVATLPGIWKNRPRVLPDASLLIQYKDSDGKVLDTWTQAISKSAKNDAELLTVTVDKISKKGSLEVYLQNNSKNSVYYWGYETTSKNKKNTSNILTDIPVSLSVAGCPSGYLPNGNGMCCSPFTGECISEGGGSGGGGTSPPSTTPTNVIRVQGSCPSGFLPNGQGGCFSPFTGQSTDEECPTGFEDSGDVDNEGHTICQSVGSPIVIVTAPAYPTIPTIPSTNPLGIPATSGDGYSGGGSGGGNGAGTTNPVVTPLDPDKNKCVDDVYKYYYNPGKIAIRNEFNLKYRTIFLEAMVGDLYAWVRGYTTDFDKGFNVIGPMQDEWFRTVLKETWQTLIAPIGLIMLADNLNAKIQALSLQEEAKLTQLDIDTIKKINDCRK